MFAQYRCAARLAVVHGSENRMVTPLQEAKHREAVQTQDHTSIGIRIKKKPGCFTPGFQILQPQQPSVHTAAACSSFCCASTFSSPSMSSSVILVCIGQCLGPHIEQNSACL